MEKYVLIVAGGEGSRLPSGMPKQFIELNNLPLLMHTFRAFSFLDASIVLVLPENGISLWEELCQKHSFSISHKVVSGGPERFHSVKSGLKQIPDDALVGIHDGVRPMVSRDTIERAFDMAERKGNGVPAIPLRESVRETDHALNRPFDRKQLRIVQTPQVFFSTLIKKAYNCSFDERFTDDATVLEAAGFPINLTEGSEENIKVTLPVDLAIAEYLLSKH
jgi:2-C-methyl-D-erythritol 4-phosphate cytidylyltransferase